MPRCDTLCHGMFAEPQGVPCFGEHVDYDIQLLADLGLSLQESSAALLARFWLPVSGLPALLSATASAAAGAADEGVCAAVGGWWTAAGWTTVLAGVPAVS